jgi:hypothetical protein
MQYKQIIVSGNDAITTGLNSDGQYVIIVGIAADWNRKRRWGDDFHS